MTKNDQPSLSNVSVSLDKERMKEVEVETHPLIVAFDTSGFRNIGHNLNSDHYRKLLLCSVNGLINLHIPDVLIFEYAKQLADKKRDNMLLLSEEEQRAFSWDRQKEVEDRKLRSLLRGNEAQIISITSAHRREAHSKMEAGLPPFKEANYRDDYRDGLIHEAIRELAANFPQARVYAIIGDKRLRASFEVIDNVQTFECGKKFVERHLQDFREFPKDFFIPDEEDLQLLQAPAYGGETEEPPPSLENFDMEAAQAEMAERFKLSQKCLVAASHLMFPATNKSDVAEKIKLAWGIKPAETERAAGYLMNEGHIEDLYGDYNVLNEDFAEQAIFALGDDINRLIEVLD